MSGQAMTMAARVQCLDHTALVCVIRYAESDEGTLNQERVWDDPALQASRDGALPIFEGACDRGVRRIEFTIRTIDRRGRKEKPISEFPTSVAV
jgi:hypothetical protein